MEFTVERQKTPNFFVDKLANFHQKKAGLSAEFYVYSRPARKQKISAINSRHFSDVFTCNLRVRFVLFESPEGKGFACLGGSARPRRRSRVQAASYQTDSPPRKIRLISWGSMSLVSDIKLIRTDTTLDLSQKAEKGMNLNLNPQRLYTTPTNAFHHSLWD